MVLQKNNICLIGKVKKVFIFSWLYSSVVPHVSSLLEPLLLHQVCAFLYYYYP